jgi:hypothetical protein
MREVPGAGMTPAGEAGEPEMASGVWSGMVDLASTPTLSINLAVLSFAIYGREDVHVGAVAVA